MRLPVATALLAATLLPLGCDQFQPAPLVSRSEFPNALKGLERRIEDMVAAIKADKPESVKASAERASQLATIARGHAAKSGLGGGEKTSFYRAIDLLVGLLGELQTQSQDDQFPESFDPELACRRLEMGLASLRAALPADLASFLEQEKLKRDVSRREAQGPAPDARAETPPPGGVIAAVVARAPTGRTAPLCPSVMLWDNASRELAPERVNRVAELMAGVPPNRRWVQLVPTLHARLNDDLSIAQYGVMLNRRSSWQSPSNFEAATDGLTDRLRDTFAGAIGQAVRRGLHIAILPHLDPAGDIEAWRNRYRFAPGQRIDAGSYESLLIEPLAQAIEAEAATGTRVDLALSGEMGRSLFEHPEEYLTILRRLRQRFAKNPRTAGVRVGVSLNWDGLTGEAGALDGRAVSRLFAACDFVGCSLYCPVQSPPVASDFSQSVNDFRDRLRPLAGEAATNLPLVISEIGLGGGDTPQTPSAEVAAEPWSGRGHPGFDPWRTPGKSRLRRGYHAALCDCLARCNVERAFLWSEGPWDPQGIADRRFRDEEIAARIGQHNRTTTP